MNREIKFRAKRKDNNEWVYGSLLQENTRIFIGNYSHKILYGERVAFCETNKWVTFGLIEVIPETVCQYTGLKDKNGVEIYENDIIKYPSEIEYQIMFDPSGYWCLDGNGIRNSEMLFQDDINFLIEVIGNKFDEEVK